MNVSHILVKHFFEAEDLIRKLKEGKSFESLARQYSLCSSAEIGGWLGDLSGKNIDPNFKLAMENLKPSEISPPIKTKFGFHLIKIEEN